MISQKLMQLRSPNLTKKCSNMSPGNPFISGLECQRSRSRHLLRWYSFARVGHELLWVLASSSVFYFTQAFGRLIAWSLNNKHRQRMMISFLAQRSTLHLQFADYCLHQQPRRCHGNPEIARQWSRRRDAIKQHSLPTPQRHRYRVGRQRRMRSIAHPLYYFR